MFDSPHFMAHRKCGVLHGNAGLKGRERLLKLAGASPESGHGAVLRTRLVKISVLCILRAPVIPSASLDNIALQCT
jgi:hypothetical protein